MDKSEKRALKVIGFLIVSYIVIAPYMWWQTAVEERDMYKAMYKATQAEAEAIEADSKAMLPPPSLS